MTEYNKTDTGHPKSERSANAAPTPKATPIIPPETLMMIDSIKNWNNICLPLAPMDIRKPISRVRSVTETYMIFMIPIPPTNREIPPIQAKSIVKTFVAIVNTELISSKERTVKSSSCVPDIPCVCLNTPVISRITLFVYFLSATETYIPCI